LAARFADLVGARDAIKALENAGIDGDEIALLGPAAERARRPVNPKPTDRRVVLYLAGRVLRGALIGAAIGLVVATLVGVVVLLVTDLAAGLLVACVLGGAFLGATVGAFVSVERSVGLADDWALTFEEATGPVWVGVYTSDASDRARARQALERAHPLELRALTSGSAMPDGPGGP
jgi:hypothetical protein